jgi:hypothetical protein
MRLSSVRPPSWSMALLVAFNLCILLGLSLTASQASTASKPTEAKPRVLQGSVSRSTLVDALDKVGIKAIIADGAPPTLAVDEVHMGTAAYYGGVDQGDVIKHINQTPTTLVLTIDRNDKIYQLSLNVPGDMPDLHSGSATADVLQGLAKQTGLAGGVSKDGANLPKEKAKTGVAQLPIPVVDVTQHDVAIKRVGETIPEADVSEKKKLEKDLAKYDVELIVDISGSMNEIDGTGDVSKFEWCHRQVRSLAQRMAPYGKTLTITTFNNAYDVMGGCSPAKVEQIYGTVTAKGSTDLVDPLVSRLDAKLNHDPKHPVLIAVITDGLPNVPKDPKVVDQALIDYSHRLNSPGQIIVTFLQIGDTFNGKDFCRNLDDNLVREGAKYDIVDTKTFDELKSEGLVDALIDAIVENQKYGTLSADAKHLAKFAGSVRSKGNSQESQDLHQLQDERHAIEQQILQR